MININKTKAFTLIEMIIVLVLTSILAATMGSSIIYPIQAYVNSTKRAELVDAAEMAMRRIERDVRRAVPNSIRVRTSGDVRALEMVHTVNAFRYRAEPPGDFLSFNVGGDSDFDVQDTFDANLLGTFNYRLVVNNRAETSTDLYANADVITPESTFLTFTNNAGIGHIQLSSPFQFTSQSPRQRVYVADTPVTYRCNRGNTGIDPNKIRRYWGYSIQSTQPIDSNSAPLSTASNALLSHRVSSCEFEYLSSDPSERNAILNISLTITDGAENVRLLHQITIGNAP